MSLATPQLETASGSQNAEKVTYGIVKSYGNLQRRHPGLCLPDLRYDDCDSIEAAVEKYKTLRIYKFVNGAQVNCDGAFYCVCTKEIGARLPFVSKEAMLAAKKNSQVNWQKLEHWYGFLPEWRRAAGAKTTTDPFDYSKPYCPASELPASEL